MAVLRYPNRLWPDISNAFEEFDQVRRQMDRFLSVFMTPGAAPLVSGVFPPLLVREDGDNILVEAEIPGIKAEDMEISVIGKTLTLSGERKPANPENASFHRRERQCGGFRKALTLPEEINTEAVRAECKDGVLRIVLPKADHAKPRKISVTGE